jgi:hypothetical protein
MIAGSHHPGEYNGFEIVCGSGTIHGADIPKIRRLIERRDFFASAGSPSCPGGVLILDGVFSVWRL